MFSRVPVPSVKTYVNQSIVVLDIAQDFKAAKLPLAALGCVYRGDLEVAVYRGCVTVDELEGFL